MHTTERFENTDNNTHPSFFEASFSFVVWGLVDGCAYLQIDSIMNNDLYANCDQLKRQTNFILKCFEGCSRQED